jgi:hypothetical protein
VLVQPIVDLDVELLARFPAPPFEPVGNAEGAARSPETPPDTSF